jgi:hypothetical protein
VQNSVFPVYAGSSAPEGALGIKRAPRRVYAPAVSDRTWPERTKSLSLPSSGPSAAPAPISRHRIHLCRAVAMFDHWGAAPSAPNEPHTEFTQRMQEGVGENYFGLPTRPANLATSATHPRSIAALPVVGYPGHARDARFPYSSRRRMSNSSECNPFAQRRSSQSSKTVGQSLVTKS